jgi:hypothetical protein
MTASSADTAELPRVRSAPSSGRGGPSDWLAALESPIFDPPVVSSQVPDALLDPDRVPLHDAGVPSTAASGQPEPVPEASALRLAPSPQPDDAELPAVVPIGRAERREERRLARRQQLRYAALGASILLGTLAATVVVLDAAR